MSYPSQVTKDAIIFLDGKAYYFVYEKYCWIRIYGFPRQPYLIPQYVMDRFILLDLCRQMASLHVENM